MRLWCGPVIECPPQVSTLHSLHLAADATQFYEPIYPSAQESTVGSTAPALYRDGDIEGPMKLADEATIADREGGLICMSAMAV